MQETITHRLRKASSGLLLAVAVAICHMLLVTLDWTGPNTDRSALSGYPKTHNRDWILVQGTCTP